MDFPVIYIAGSGRCGSTLLERVLGEIPGYVNVGELIQMARETAPQNKRAGAASRSPSARFGRRPANGPSAAGTARAWRRSGRRRPG